MLRMEATISTARSTTHHLIVISVELKNHGLRYRQIIVIVENLNKSHLDTSLK